MWCSVCDGRPVCAGAGAHVGPDEEEHRGSARQVGTPHPPLAAGHQQALTVPLRRRQGLQRELEAARASGPAGDTPPERYAAASGHQTARVLELEGERDELVREVQTLQEALTSMQKEAEQLRAMAITPLPPHSGNKCEAELEGTAAPSEGFGEEVERLQAELAVVREEKTRAVREVAKLKEGIQHLTAMEVIAPTPPMPQPRSLAHEW